MIKTIRIRNFKSFPKGRHVVIDLSRDNKPITVFYGLNGAGKSAIGEVVERNGNDKEPLPDCNIETTGGLAYRYLVYNQSFIERSFQNVDGFPGIFTVGEPQADALRRSEKIEAELPSLEAELERLGVELETLHRQREQAENSLAQTIWGFFQALKSSPLREFLRYGNDKKGFVDKVRSIQLTSEAPPSLDELARLRRELGDGQSRPRDPVRLDMEELRRLESDPIWGGPIEGSGESRLAPLIERLKNQDWVRHGASYLHESDTCPFCQQGLPPGFEEELNALFDVTYQQKIAYLKSAAVNYQAAADKTESALEYIFANEPFAVEDASLQTAARELRIALSKNVIATQAKVEAPGSIVSLRSTEELRKALSRALEYINERIGTYNRRITRHKDELGYVEIALWQRLAKDAGPAIATFTKAEAPRRLREEEVLARRIELGDQARALRDELDALHTGTTSTDQAVAAINERLAFLGIDGFRIDRHSREGDLYQLIRPGRERSEFISLSEGEKTLITFLYFLEMVKGAAEPIAAVPLKRTIVVVDDPISSLSHNHVYDIAALIARDLAPLTDQNPNGVRQLIVLTHSLFFFHELKHASHKLRKHMLFKRVVKIEESDVEDMQEDGVGNDYEAFWQIIKDAHEVAAKPATLANAMRCVLEHFFYFVSEELEYDGALSVLVEENPGFRSFARYLDRGSHADRFNVADFSDHDARAFLAQFRSIFDITGHIKHYNRMMGVEVSPI